MRVVVRHRTPQGDLTDALGEIVALDEDGLVVATRRGDVRIEGTRILLGKPVPPAPARRRPRRRD